MISLVHLFNSKKLRLHVTVFPGISIDEAAVLREINSGVQTEPFDGANGYSKVPVNELADYPVNSTDEAAGLLEKGYEVKTAHFMVPMVQLFQSTKLQLSQFLR